MTTVYLDLNETEARVVQEALGLYVRIHLGQAVHAMEPALHGGMFEGGDVSARYARARSLLGEAQATITGVANGGPSITNEEKVPNKARIARRLECVLSGDDAGIRLYNKDGTVRE